MFEENTEFKPIKSAPGYYITNDGRVFKVQEMSQHDNKRGYLYTNVTTEEGILTLSVHREVAKAFVEGSGETVDHLNGDKHDNRDENLQWLSLRDNVRKYFEKPYCFEHKDGRSYSCNILRDFAREFNLDPSAISKLLKGRLHYHKGWRVSSDCASTS